jgi:hypothetical protein
MNTERKKGKGKRAISEEGATKREASSLADLDAVLKQLDQSIAAEHVAMDSLLERMGSRNPRQQNGSDPS